MIRRLVLAIAALLLIGAGDRRSGYDDASPETRAMQDDDAANPACEGRIVTCKILEERGEHVAPRVLALVDAEHLVSVP